MSILAGKTNLGDRIYYLKALQLILMTIDVSKYKKTKIIATIGPASEEKIEALMRAGVNGIRLNFSHNTHAWHKSVVTKVRAAAKKLERSVAIIQDLQGPKIRVGTLPPGGLAVQAGGELKFGYDADYGKDAVIPLQFDFSGYVKKGDLLYIRDGTIKTRVRSVRDGVITVEAENSGKFLSNHGINLPDTKFDSKAILTDKDHHDLNFAGEGDVDYVALSFVQSAADIKHLRTLLARHKSGAKIIAKIETKVATENLESIIKASDAVMIARGDLAIETSPEEVPLIGREIITLARYYKRPVIMATQMLESMISSPQPTRAEANDVATAVSLGVDAVMLSGETAMGQYPVDTVRLMKRIILHSEAFFMRAALTPDTIPEGDGSIEQPTDHDPSFIRRLMGKTRGMLGGSDPGRIADQDAQTSVSLATTTLAEQLRVELILAETMTGSTALSLASLRPSAPIIMASPNRQVCNQLAIVWGGKPFLVSKMAGAEGPVIRRMKAKKHLKSGDLVVAAFGRQRGVAGGTDTIRLLEVQ